MIDRIEKIVTFGKVEHVLGLTGDRGLRLLAGGTRRYIRPPLDAIAGCRQGVGR